MAKVSSASTPDNAAEKAYVYILNKTINFGFLPGERINEVELATTLGMSRAPVREALNRLVTRELVIFEAGKGFYCRKLSTTEVVDLFEVRSSLEKASITKVLNNPDGSAVAAFVRKWQAYDWQKSRRMITEMIAVDEDFHIELASLSGNVEFVKILKNINERIRFIRKIRIESMENNPTFIDEHLEIVDALAQGKLGTILDIMDKHFAIDFDTLKVHINEGLARIYANEIT